MAVDFKANKLLRLYSLHRQNDDIHRLFTIHNECLFELFTQVLPFFWVLE
jgi:hypothetical protein